MCCALYLKKNLKTKFILCFIIYFQTFIIDFKTNKQIYVHGSQK